MTEATDHTGSAATPALAVRGLSAGYNGRPVLSDIEFNIPRGERVAVIGPNGAGKSTLFKVIVGLLTPQAGEVWVHGHSHQAGDCPSLGYVPQREQVDWTFPVSVADVVMMGRTREIGWLRQAGERDRQAVREALENVGMQAWRGASIGELSGGQQQRVFMARALAQQADILLLDEPLSGIDPQAQAALLDTLDELRQRDVTVLLATHDLDLAVSRFDRVMVLAGRMVALGPPRDVFRPETLMHAYGHPVAPPGSESNRGRSA